MNCCWNDDDGDTKMVMFELPRLYMMNTEERTLEYTRLKKEEMLATSTTRVFAQQVPHARLSEAVIGYWWLLGSGTMCGLLPTNWIH